MAEAITVLLMALELAGVIAGEAPGCPVEARLAVAHVYSRNDVWFGQGIPTSFDVWLALNWQRFPDPTKGAQYLIGPGDFERMARQGLHLVERTARFDCGHTWLEAWR